MASKTVFVRDIQDQTKVESVFLVKHKALQQGKTGKPYLNLVLIDKSGEIEGRVWEDAAEVAEGFDKDDFVSLKARAQGFQGRTQLNVSSIRRCHETDLELADFLPATSKNVEAMFADLNAIIAGMQDVYLKQLLEAFVKDPGLAWRIKSAPAARSMHHPYVGGLLEHTLSAMKLMQTVGAHYHAEGYTEINRDLLLTGIFLHDIGKLLELDYKRSFDYSDAGRLIGHLVIGVEMVNERAAKIPGFPEELRLLVNHMIVAHHGQLEYGSPKRPKTLEAFIVHQIDDLDAKINAFSMHMRKEREQPGAWTTYNRMWDRYFYKKPYESQLDEAFAGHSPLNEAAEQDVEPGGAMAQALSRAGVRNAD